MASDGCHHKDGAIRCPHTDSTGNSPQSRPVAFHKNEILRSNQLPPDRVFYLHEVCPVILRLAVSQSVKRALPSRISRSRSSKRSLCHWSMGRPSSRRHKLSHKASIASSFSSSVIWSICIKAMSRIYLKEMNWQNCFCGKLTESEQNQR